MKRYLKILLVVVLLTMFIPMMHQTVLAAPSTPGDALENLTKLGPTFGFAKEPGIGIAAVVQRVIYVFLGLLGIIFIGLIIYAGYNWMTAMGEAEKVKKAQQTLLAATIGLIIILSSYVISYYVINELTALNP